MPVRRVFYFSIIEEKDNFLKSVKTFVGKVQNQNTSEKELVRETLIKIVQDDKFLDYFIQLLNQKQ